MVDYQRIEMGGVLIDYRRLSDGAQISIDPGNADYAALAALIEDGYEPLPADPPPDEPEPGPSIWDLIAEMYASIDTSGDEAMEELVAVNVAQAALLKEGLGG